MVCNPTHAQGLHIWFILHKTKRDKTKIKKGEREDDAGHLIHVYMTASDAIVSLPIFIIKGQLYSLLLLAHFSLYSNPDNSFMKDSPTCSFSRYLQTRTQFYMHTLYPNVFFVMFTIQPPTAIYASLTDFLFTIPSPIVPMFSFIFRIILYINGCA